MSVGAQAYVIEFHRECPAIRVVSNGGFLWVYCPECRVIARLDEARKFPSLAEAAQRRL